MIYGRAGLPPDTTSFQTINLNVPNGKASLLQDITGDNIPELLVHTGNADHEEKVKVYVGIKGQRLIEQFGSGDDLPHPQQWWGKPWSEVWLVHLVQPYWAYSDPDILDLGDGNADGIGDVWAYSKPFLLCYSGGTMLDSLVDGLLNVGSIENLEGRAQLGDIDGSGISTRAISNGGTIYFFKPSAKIPRDGVPRRLPSGTGPSDVEPAISVTNQLSVTASPNPGSGDILIRWSGAGSSPTIMMITDMMGREVVRRSFSPEVQSTHWQTEGMTSGIYNITIINRDISISTLPMEQGRTRIVLVR